MKVIFVATVLFGDFWKFGVFVESERFAFFANPPFDGDFPGPGTWI